MKTILELHLGKVGRKQTQLLDSVLNGDALLYIKGLYYVRRSGKTRRNLGRGLNHYYYYYYFFFLHIMKFMKFSFQIRFMSIGRSPFGSHDILHIYVDV